MTTTRYYVEDEHSLLYRQPGMSLYGILTGKLLRGGRNWRDGLCAPDEAKLRPATRDDFEAFCVCHKGYFPSEVSANG
jgi:hypothetical protein